MQPFYDNCFDVTKVYQRSNSNDPRKSLTDEANTAIIRKKLLSNFDGRK